MEKLLIAVLISIILFFTISVAFSSHSITICGEKYICGDKDGLCPEDFPGFGKCDVKDPDCGGASPTIPGAPSSIVGSFFVYNCTGIQEINDFTKIPNSSIYSLDGYCLDLRVANSSVIDNSNSGIMWITLEENKNITGNYSIYKTFKINSTVNVDGSIFNVRIPKTWSRGIIKRTISLEKMDGKKYNLTYLTSDIAFDYYQTKTNGFGTYYIIGEKKPSIWYVIHKIDLYYGNKISFINVLKVILDYYE